MVLIHGGDIEGYRLEYGKMPLDFSANCNPLGLPKEVRRAICLELEQAEHYPDPLCRELSAAIAQREGIGPEMILCGNGAADLIFRLVWALKPKHALLTAPTFAEYELALNSVGSEVRHQLLLAERGFELGSEILSQLSPELDILFLCNPNNPTGLLIDADLLRRILGRCKELGILLVVDECFNGLLDEPEQHTLRPELPFYDNLLILDAFTKLYAMPGLRLGYALCKNSGLLAAMAEAGQPWAVSTPAQIAGLAALEDHDYLRQTRRLLRKERSFLWEGLAELGFTVLGGAANFIFFHSHLPGLAEGLRKQGVLIRDCENYLGLGRGYYRVAVRSREENKCLLKQIKNLAEDDDGCNILPD